MNESRQDAWKRISEMAGVDEEGGILPPPKDFKINRAPVSWWQNASDKASAKQELDG